MGEDIREWNKNNSDENIEEKGGEETEKTKKEKDDKSKMETVCYGHMENMKQE